MLVRDRMIRRVIAAQPQDSSVEARRLMDRHGLRHLPILRGRRLIGIVSDRDVRRVLAARVQDIMTLDPISVSPDASMDEAARVMDAVRISCLPVVENKRVVGVVTTTDILRAFVDLSGAADHSTRVVLVAKNARTVESRVRQVVHDCHAELKWLYRHGRRVQFRVQGGDIDAIVTALEAAGDDVAAVIASPSTAARAARPISPKRARAQRS